MKTVFKKILDSVFRAASSIMPDPFSVEASFGCKATKGEYMLPINYDLLPLHVQEELRIGYDINEVKIYKLRNVFISPEGIIFKNIKIFLPSLASTLIKDLLGHAFLVRQFTPFLKPFIEFEDSVIVAHDQWSQNYYHWMIDLLPKLLLLDDKLKQNILILPQYGADYMTLTLSALGYKSFYKVKDNSVLKAKTVFLPDRTAIGNLQNPELLGVLRELLVKAFCPGNVRATRRIYVSRARSQKRRLINEHEIINILKKYEFEHLYFEELTFLQQIEVMQQAQVLIGVHGANLVNILFMQQGTNVIELMNSDFTNLVYYRMASTLKLPYYLVPCSPDPSNKDKSDGTIFTKNDVDIEINPSDLKNILQKIFLY